MASRDLKVTLVGEDKTGAALGSAGGRFDSFGKKAGAALLAVGAAGVAGLAFSVKAFADFDSQLNKSIAIMGDVSDVMRKDMSDAAREVGKTTKFSAAEAAEAYFFLASAGMSAEQSVAALPQVAKFAQAGMFDMAKATDLATDAQSALGLASKDPAQNLENLTRVTDVFVKANTLANTSVEQIATAMTNKAGAALRTYGKSIEEGSAALMVFADQGIKGEAAGTMLTSTLDGLAKASLANGDKFRALGIEVFDAEGNMRNLADITGDLEGALGGMSSEQQMATLTSLGFNKQALDGIRALMGSSDALREYEGELQNAGGTVEEVAAKQLQTFSAQLGLLKDRLMDVAIEVGSRVVPVLLRLMEGFDRALAALQPFFDVVKNGFAAFFLSMKDGDVTSDGFVGAMERLGVKVGEVFTAVKKFAGEASAFLIGTVIPAAKRIYTDSKPFLDTLAATFKSIFDAIRVVIAVFVALVTGIWRTFGETLVSFAKAAFDNIRQVIDGALRVVKGILDVFVGVFTGDWRRAWDGIKSIFSGVWEAIKGILGLAVAAVKGILSAAMDAILGDWRRAWDAVKSALSAAWEAIKSAVGAGVSATVSFVAELPGRAIAALSSFGGMLNSSARSAFESFKSGASQKGGELISWVAGIPGRIVGALGNLGSLLADAGRRVIQGFIDGITGAFGKVRDTLGRLTSMLPDWKGPPRRDASILRGAGRLVMGGFERGLRDEFGSIKSTMADATDLLSLGLPGGTGRMNARLASTSSSAPAEPRMRQGAADRTDELIELLREQNELLRRMPADYRLAERAR